MAASGAADESSNLSRATIRQAGVCTFSSFNMEAGSIPLKQKEEERACAQGSSSFGAKQVRRTTVAKTRVVVLLVLASLGSSRRCQWR